MHSALFVVLSILVSAVPCRAQSALQTYTGLDGGITVPADPRLVPPTGLTVEAWIIYSDRTLPFTGQFYAPTIVRQNLQSGQEVYSLRVNASNTRARNLEWSVRVGGVLQTVTYAFAAGEFSKWTHVAATFDGKTISIFKNGRQVVTRGLTTSSELVYTGDVLRIGNGVSVPPGRETWNGTIDELRIWPVARSAGEILSTKDFVLGWMAGRILNFPLDGTGQDLSTGLFGSTFGVASFVPGVPGLIGRDPGVSPIGQSTTTCGRSIDSLATTMPMAGNSDFALWAVGGPRPTVSRLGVLFGATMPAPSGFPLVLGIDIAFDFSAVFCEVPVPLATGTLGNARLALPLPNDAALSGSVFVFQWVFLDPVCGPQGLTASDGLQISVQ